MTTSPGVRDAQRVRLPDGTSWHCPSRNDALMIWREIFDDRCYGDAVRGVARGETVLDVGAHCGLASLYVSRAVPDARILAFEPAQVLHRCLTRNLRDHVPGATAYRRAVGRTEGPVRFTYYPKAPCQSGMYAHAERDRDATRHYLENNEVVGEAAEYLLDGLHEPRVEHVYVTTLSAALAAYGVGEVALLKVDVERAELDVLEGIEDTDWPRIRTVVAEVHEDEGHLDRSLALFGAHGYSTEVDQASWLAGSGLHTVTARR